MKAVDSMKAQNCEEVVLETEVTNKGSLGLYEKLGFIKDKRLYRYYLNGVDAFRLKMYLPRPDEVVEEQAVPVQQSTPAVASK